MAKRKSPKEIIKPNIRVDGDKGHLLEQLFDGEGDLPTLTSIGYTSLGPGNSWVSYVIKTKGKEVLSIEVDEPNVRAIAEESSKINFVSQFVDRGF